MQDTIITVMGATVNTGRKIAEALLDAGQKVHNEERAKPHAGRTPENTTPTRFEDFVGELARAYRAA